MNEQVWNQLMIEMDTKVFNRERRWNTWLRQRTALENLAEKIHARSRLHSHERQLLTRLGGDLDGVKKRIAYIKKQMQGMCG